MGIARSSPTVKVELFELFDDPFVRQQFARRRQLFSEQIQRITWLPTPEDVIVQKLRGGGTRIWTTPATAGRAGAGVDRHGLHL